MIESARVALRDAARGCLLTLLALGIVVGCGPGTAGAASGGAASGQFTHRGQGSYSYRLTGDATTSWIQLPAGEYVVEGTIGNPASCVNSINLVDQHRYPRVQVVRPGGIWFDRRPGEPPPPSPKPDQLVSWTTDLAAGSYRFEVSAPAACSWKASVHPPALGSNPKFPVAARCGDVQTLPEGEFIRISGRVVAAPQDNPLASDSQPVQPQGTPMSSYAVGVSDGSGVCTVLWSTNAPAVGKTVSITAEVLARLGRKYLGIVCLEAC